MIICIQHTNRNGGIVMCLPARDLKGDRLMEKLKL